MKNLDDLLNSFVPDTYRAGDKDFERARRAFYAAMATHHNFDGWNMKPKEKAPEIKSAKRKRRGKRSKVRYGDRRTKSYMMRYGGTVEMLERETALLVTAERRQTARMLQEIHEDAQITPLRSPGFEASVDFSSGGMTPSDYKIHHLELMSTLREGMPPYLMTVIEDVIFRQVFTWEGKTKEHRKTVLRELRFALDFAAHLIGGRQVYLTERELVERWPEAGAYLFEKRLRPFVHAARVIPRTNTR